MMSHVKITGSMTRSLAVDDHPEKLPVLAVMKSDHII